MRINKTKIGFWCLWKFFGYIIQGGDQMLFAASCNLNLMYSKVIFGNTIHLEPIKWKFQYIWNPAIPSVNTLCIPERGVKMGVLDPPLPCGSPHSIPLMKKWQLSCLQVFWQWMFCCWHDSAYWKSEPIVLSFTIDGLAAIVVAIIAQVTRVIMQCTLCYKWKYSAIIVEK